MKVRELIKFLKTQDQELEVAYQLYSEFCLLDTTEIEVKTLCKARPDGWVHDKRSDHPSMEYLVFPGN